MVVPAIFGERFPHPTTRRASLSLPFAYLAAAFALARAWRGLKGAPAWARGSALAVLAALSLGSAWMGWDAYAHRIMGSDNMRWAFNNGARLAGEIADLTSVAALNRAALLTPPT